MSEPITVTRAVAVANHALNNAEEMIILDNYSHARLFICQSFHFIMRAISTAQPRQDLEQVQNRCRQITKLLPLRERIITFLDLRTIRKSYPR